MTFIALVAVGADYNMLLISRIRDESPQCVRSGLIRTMGTTGGVITSAGLIFAASMFGLVFGSIATMVQAGFIIAVGLLLDTFLVRTTRCRPRPCWSAGQTGGRRGRGRVGRRRLAG